MKKNKTAIEHFHLLCLQWLLCHRPKKWCNAHDCTELTVFLTSNLSSFPLYFHPLLKQRRFFCAFLPHLKSHPAANYIYPTWYSVFIRKIRPKTNTQLFANHKNSEKCSAFVVMLEIYINVNCVWHWQQSLDSQIQHWVALLSASIIHNEWIYIYIVELSKCFVRTLLFMSKHCTHIFAQFTGNTTTSINSRQYLSTSTLPECQQIVLILLEQQSYCKDVHVNMRFLTQSFEWWIGINLNTDWLFNEKDKNQCKLCVVYCLIGIKLWYILHSSPRRWPIQYQILLSCKFCQRSYANSNRHDSTVL